MTKTMINLLTFTSINENETKHLGREPNSLALYCDFTDRYAWNSEHPVMYWVNVSSCESAGPNTTFLSTPAIGRWRNKMYRPWISFCKNRQLLMLQWLNIFTMFLIGPLLKTTDLLSYLFFFLQTPFVKQTYVCVKQNNVVRIFSPHPC